MRSFTLILCFSGCCRGNNIYNDEEAPQPLLERKRGVWRATLDELRSGEAMLLEKYEVTLLATERGQEEAVARRRLGGAEWTHRTRGHLLARGLRGARPA